MRFLSFVVENEEFGIPLEQVREVIAFPDITPMPNSFDYHLGIMSLRDEIIPIVDLRMRFKLVPTLTHDTAVIICDLGSCKYGAVVDCINSVIAPEDSEILAIPSAGEGGAGRDFATKAVRSGKHLVVIIDMGKILDPGEKEILQAAGKEAA